MCPVDNTVLAVQDRTKVFQDFCVAKSGVLFCTVGDMSYYQAGDGLLVETQVVVTKPDTVL